MDSFPWASRVATNSAAHSTSLRLIRRLTARWPWPVMKRDSIDPEAVDAAVDQSVRTRFPPNDIASSQKP